MIEFALPTSSYVELSVYNVEGRMVKTLVQRSMSAGNHSIEWNGTTSNGNQASTGMYIYRLTTDSYTSAKKMLLLK